MRTNVRILAALLTVWVAVILLMALAPQANGLRVAEGAPDRQVAALAAGSPRADTFTHTGLWAIEVGVDGTVAYVRDIRRR
ncbi:MAG: hypothetical protein JJ899_04680 [Alphaproteobacteria bacterium]|nr:hypothetical protein [Alphaproteobacteria bacterium]